MPGARSYWGPRAVVARGRRERELHLRRRRAAQAEEGLERGRDLNVRPPARHAVVERVHREGDESIPQPPIALAIVVLARTLSQRLQRGPQRGATDLGEDALDDDHTIGNGRQGQRPRLHALFLFV